MNEKKRLDYIDIAKGIGMLAIIWGHIMERGPTNVFVYSFHIPLFFFMSGMVFHREKYGSFREFALRKIRTLVIPYLLFSFLTWAVWVLYSIAAHSNVAGYAGPLLQTFFAQGSGGYLVHNVPLWFVTCLLAVEILYYFISGADRDAVVLILCGILAAVSWLFEKGSFLFDFKLLPWSLGAAFSGIVFYAAGNLAARNGLTERVRDLCGTRTLLCWIALILMTAVLAFLSAANGHVSMGHEQYGASRLLFYVNGFTGTGCVLLFSMLTEKYSSSRALSCIKWIGLNSLYFMFIENPVKGFAAVAVSKLLHITGEELSERMGPCLIAFILSVAATAAVVKLILIIVNGRRRKNVSAA